MPLNNMIEAKQKTVQKERTNKRRGYAFIKRLKSLIVGAGDTVFGADSRGIWAGAKDYADAPWKVDMEGNQEGLGNINAGTFGGWTITPNSIESPEDANGFKVILDSANKKIEFDGGASLKNTATPFSGTGGMALEHDTGLVMVEVSGEGEGLGSQQVLLKVPDESVYMGLQVDTPGNAYIIMNGLPTSNPGSSGRIWNDGGTLKIT